jgi:hypothetical protein
MIAGLREAMKQPVERRHAAILAADVAGYGARSELRTRTRLSALCCVRPCINGRSEDPARYCRHCCQALAKEPVERPQPDRSA